MHNLVEESFAYIPSGKYLLAAMIGTPKVSDRLTVPTVVLCHGFGGTKTEVCRHFVRLANKLVHKGCVTVRFDFAGFGDSVAPSTAFSISQAVDDIRAVVEYIKDRNIGSVENLGILGFSFGGLIAAYAVGAGLPFKSACLVSAVERFIPPKETQPASRQNENSECDSEPFHRGFLLSHKFVDEFLSCNGSSRLAASSIPVQLIHGTDDQTVPVDHAHNYASAINTGSFAPVFIDGGDHAYSDRTFQRQLDQRVVAFFSDTLSI
ncbi:MAG: alpha/beta fold hydrolase [Candidatus Auribacterota bacterium]|jgi:pimeloyl-ACP methyl ester carboxylesterase|nr:alpha/beta fold hydrolase [Candidatus Auribacterota bacterium]